MREAKSRWLRPSEICEILRNHNRFNLTVDPPHKPPSGSLFLLNRKVLRYFRKDGHCWRKKKDGRTVREAHEKLKTGSVDALHCYYAHGEDNKEFQRRIYWLLDEKLENIVLVHYRDLSEESRILADTDPTTVSQGTYTSSIVFSTCLNSNFAIQESYPSSPSTADCLQTLSDFEENSGNECGAVPDSLFFTPFSRNDREENGLFDDGENFSRYAAPSSLWSEMLTTNQEIGGMHDSISFEQTNCSDGLTKIITDSLLNSNVEVRFALSGEYNVSPTTHSQSITADGKAEFQEKVENDVYVSSLLACENMMDESSDACDMPNDHYLYGETQFNNDSMSQVNILGSDQPLDYKIEVSLIPKNAWENETHLHEHGELNKLDIRYLPEANNSSHQVLVPGRFLGNMNTNFKWHCTSGEYEVPDELLSTDVTQCQAPAHTPGQVPFYITHSNRPSSIEVREFEYHEDRPDEIFSPAPESVHESETYLQLRFAKMVSLRADSKTLVCAVKNCQKCNLKEKLFPMLCDDITGWDKIEKDYKTLQGCNRSPKDALVQHMLKRRLYELLVYKAHEEGRGLNVLDEKGQGIIHLAAALGYQWAMRPIVTAGVSPSFRDAQGRTGLHWAAYYGREETVLELVKLGAAPGAIKDPTSKYPEGQTAADLAWIKGHNGIAGYLAESDLTSHPSNLAFGESVMETVSANVAAEDDYETLQMQITGPLDGDEGDQLELTAVRNPDHAARHIQAALKSESWHKRLLTRSNDNISEISDDALVVSSLSNQDHRLSHFNDYLHTVAGKSQQKHHGYRGHKDFLKVHNRLVKK